MLLQGLHIANGDACQSCKIRLESSPARCFFAQHNAQRLLFILHDFTTIYYKAVVFQLECVSPIVVTFLHWWMCFLLHGRVVGSPQTVLASATSLQFSHLDYRLWWLCFPTICLQKSQALLTVGHCRSPVFFQLSYLFQAPFFPLVCLQRWIYIHSPFLLAFVAVVEISDLGLQLFFFAPMVLVLPASEKLPPALRLGKCLQLYLTHAQYTQPTPASQYFCFRKSFLHKKDLFPAQMHQMLPWESWWRCVQGLGSYLCYSVTWFGGAYWNRVRLEGLDSPFSFPTFALGVIFSSMSIKVGLGLELDVREQKSRYQQLE